MNYFHWLSNTLFILNWFLELFINALNLAYFKRVLDLVWTFTYLLCQKKKKLYDQMYNAKLLRYDSLWVDSHLNKFFTFLLSFVQVKYPVWKTRKSTSRVMAIKRKLSPQKSFSLIWPNCNCLSIRNNRTFQFYIRKWLLSLILQPLSSQIYLMLSLLFSACLSPPQTFSKTPEIAWACLV